LVEVRADRDGLVDPDLLGLVVADRLAEVVADAARFVDPGADRGAVDDRHVPVFLAVDVDLLGPGGIVEAQLVAAAAARRRVGPPAALGRAARDRERIRILAVVDAAGHQRTIRVALEELDQHLHADPRDELRAPAFARSALRAADPARRPLAEAGVFLPVKLDLNATVLVGVDLTVADHGRSLPPVDPRIGGPSQRPNDPGRGHALEGVGVVLAAARVGSAAAVGDAGDDVLVGPAGVVERVGGELPTRANADRVAVAAGDVARQRQRVGEVAATLVEIVALEPTVVVIVDPPDPIAVVGAGRLGGQQILGREPVEVAAQHLGGGQVLRPVEIVDGLAVGAPLTGAEPGKVGAAAEALRVRVVAVVVGQGQHLVAGVGIVIVEEADSLFFEQPTDKVMIALAILHAVC